MHFKKVSASKFLTLSRIKNIVIAKKSTKVSILTYDTNQLQYKTFPLQGVGKRLYFRKCVFADILV